MFEVIQIALSQALLYLLSISVTFGDFILGLHSSVWKSKKKKIPSRGSFFVLVVS